MYNVYIANKLLGRQCLNFEQLTTPEQQLWSLFEKSDIFEFLTGQTDTVPQFENYFALFCGPLIVKCMKSLNGRSFTHLHIV